MYVPEENLDLKNKSKEQIKTFSKMVQYFQFEGPCFFYLTSWATCNDPSFINFRLRLLNRSREYCLDAFLQSVPAFIIVENSS